MEKHFLCFLIVALGAILPNLFPGWVTSSATLITYTFGIGEGAIPYIAIGLHLTVGLVVTVSPVGYNTIERVERVLVSIILVFIVFAIFVAIKGSSVFFIALLVFLLYSVAVGDIP